MEAHKNFHFICPGSFLQNLSVDHGCNRPSVCLAVYGFEGKSVFIYFVAFLTTVVTKFNVTTDSPFSLNFLRPSINLPAAKGRIIVVVRTGWLSVSLCIQALLLLIGWLTYVCCCLTRECGDVQEEDTDVVNMA